MLQNDILSIGFSTDKPITSIEEDRFSRSEYASRIADSVMNMTDPSSLVIGINGDWGSGKSSLLNMIEQSL